MMHCPFDRFDASQTSLICAYLPFLGICPACSGSLNLPGVMFERRVFNPLDWPFPFGHGRTRRLLASFKHMYMATCRLQYSGHGLRGLILTPPTRVAGLLDTIFGGRGASFISQYEVLYVPKSAKWKTITYEMSLFNWFVLDKVISWLI